MITIGYIIMFTLCLIVSLINPGMFIGFIIMESYKTAGIIYVVIFFISEWIFILFSPMYDEDTHKCFLSCIIDSYSKNELITGSEENREPFSITIVE